MSLYESTFVTRQDVSRADVNKLVDTFTDIIKQGKGKIIKHEYWGLRNLAYRIKKNRKGHYAMLAIDAQWAFTSRRTAPCPTASRCTRIFRSASKSPFTPGIRTSIRGEGWSR